MGKAEAKARLSKHWDTFITQDDVNQIAAAGLNFIRIDVGYWAVTPQEDEPYVTGQLEYLDKALDWARAAGLWVMVDLHGGKRTNQRLRWRTDKLAPGSQNGFDNSGHRGAIKWEKGNNVAQTVTAFNALAERYASQTDVVAAIEALNEPFVPGGVSLATVKNYYHSAWDKLHQYSSDTTLALHDAFQAPDSWNSFMVGPKWNVVIDDHHYEVFSRGALSMDINGHVGSVCSLANDHLVKGYHWTIVGEWSAALTDCTKYLNGKGIGARYDGSYSGGSAIGSCAGKVQGSAASLSAEDKANTRRWIEAQLDAYEKSDGWLFWTWKTEGAPGWDMQDLLAAGLFPNPPTDRQYGPQC